MSLREVQHRGAPDFVESRRYRMGIQYDGTHFHGWQVQPQRRTVQGVLETALATLLRQQVPVSGAGRTDSGVHSRGQVGHFDCSVPFDPARLEHRLNGLLPDDLAVRGLRRCPRTFHARFSATARRYRYQLALRKSALQRERSWYTPGVNEALLRRASEGLLGRRDFRAFCARAGLKENTVCVIRRARWRRWQDGLVFEIESDRFLHHMVRNLVGTLVPIARGVWKGPGIGELLEAGDRTLAGPTAPARGLCLVQVYYRPRPECR